MNISIRNPRETKITPAGGTSRASDVDIHPDADDSKAERIDVEVFEPNSLCLGPNPPLDLGSDPAVSTQKQGPKGGSPKVDAQESFWSIWARKARNDDLTCSDRS